MTSLFSWQNVVSLSPLSLASPNPCLPMVLSFPWLSTPTFAFRSPMMSNTSWDGVSSTDACCSSKKVSFSSSSASSVGA